MQIIIANFPPATRVEEVNELLVTELGAPMPVEITINVGMGANAMALIQYPTDAPHALGDVLVNRLNGHHYKGFDLNASVTHSFKD